MRVIAKLRQIRLYRQGAKVRFEAILRRSHDNPFGGKAEVRLSLYSIHDMVSYVQITTNS